jgi:hypothetical protein
MFPNTMAYALDHSVLDHVSYVVQMESGVPKSNIFRFENHWVPHPEFYQQSSICGLCQCTEAMQPW